MLLGAEWSVEKNRSGSGESERGATLARENLVIRASVPLIRELDVEGN